MPSQFILGQIVVLCQQHTVCVHVHFLIFDHLISLPDTGRQPIPISSSGPSDISSRPPMPLPKRVERGWQPIQHSGSASEMQIPLPDTSCQPIPISSSGLSDISSRPPMPLPNQVERGWQPIQHSGSASEMHHPVTVPSSPLTISSQQQQQRTLIRATSLTNGMNTTPLPSPVTPRRPPINASTPVSNRPPLSVPPPLPHRGGGVSPEPQLSSVPRPIPTPRGSLSYSSGTKYVCMWVWFMCADMYVLADTCVHADLQLQEGSQHFMHVISLCLHLQDQLMTLYALYCLYMLNVTCSVSLFFLLSF